MRTDANDNGPGIEEESGQMLEETDMDEERARAALEEEVLYFQREMNRFALQDCLNRLRRREDFGGLLVGIVSKRRATQHAKSFDDWLANYMKEKPALFKWVTLTDVMKSPAHRQLLEKILRIRDGRQEPL